ncbi:MAG TPA: class I SAM-dependent methyltransferase [Victivallales bacterium]|nr:class I SAM-dependent methyltransferase [Victivallales bacterium]
MNITTVNQQSAVSYSNEKCILCGSSGLSLFYQNAKRDFLLCPECDLVFVPENQRLNSKEEFRRYNFHQNNPEDEGYRKFLNRIFKPMNDLIYPGSKGLDFGSGPGPVLSLMFSEVGHDMNIYDHYFNNDRSVFKKKYDFITATEVVEHLFDPLKELELLWFCLNQGGYLGIMTNLVKDQESFPKWYYKDDETHVTFFSENTFLWLQKKWNSSVSFVSENVIIFEKP